MRRPTKRRAIALRNPLAQKLWAEGKLSLKEIAAECGLPATAFHNGDAYFGCIDPTPQPLGCPPFSALPGETGEQRAKRRFPITAHKPGPS